ncbi:RdgB/HAM1 family non-canonical purine NTP pyrophosphatase [Corallococcus exiguus]|uniref:RdgB/HAM1 family non-canonical purine NTP pyrophosphatase n=1 Tax=Corallococcus TaxID=83461 RepID=UPI000EB8A91B|nr:MULTISPECIES: RdgB/HAM1 family non-canonical purine NTP pyrophosphatase [Corallococcus]NNB87080.1 RdgB/HAM1 family non-canonical purine NTP pyrophosphatase [Corallococcus exiguus]NNC08884.1 RdgB/HAM1 family non-canonical purine NTP pyrophosphatase [Corallococcus exiguus]NPC52874.1 RdgB/HAM1 family non-canonical purine NTP pyrophosphatase [Corallococcus exiguus]RKH77233.1 RdgB/HAM1 family non-canonical purine NTP pyrophosphatase [Corallococcus sp. AB032C]
MKPKLLFATGNAGKLRELRALVGDAVEVVSLQDLPPVPEPVEDGATFEENAVKKAREYSEATGLPALADDSGLCVDALDGQPGVLSARYAPGDDKARYEKLLTELADVPDEKRTASFRCALALVTGKGDEARVEVGRCEGVILRAPKGTNGFGYDPVFQVEGEGGRSMAELAPEEKSRVSHRARAFQLMRRHLLAL